MILLIISIFLFSLSIYLPILSNKVSTLHSNATKINALLKKLKLAINTKDLADISDLYNEYESQINHDTIDYERWKDTTKKIYGYHHNWFFKLLYFLTWNIYSNIIYILMIGIAYITLVK